MLRKPALFGLSPWGLRPLGLALLALSSATASATEEPPAPADQPKLKLLVMPFAALSGEVPARAGTKASGMLGTEFKSAEAFVLLDAKKAGGTTDAWTDALAQAKKLVDDAKQSRSKKKFRLADEALQKALVTWKTAAGGVTDVADVADAYALLSAVQYNTGRDEEGARSLATALALAPDRDLPLAATSALFARVVADTRKGLEDGPKGNLALESSPSNAPLMVDGLALGSSPLLVRDVPPGLHFWRAQLPNGEVVGGVVDVVAGKQAQVKATAVNKDPESRLLAAVAQNKLDADALAAAKEQAKAAEADLLVFGGLSRDGKGLGLDTFLYVAATNELRRLGRAQFDTELLSAGMEFFNLAGDVAKKGNKAGEPVKVPSMVSMTLVAGGPKTAEVKYGVVPGKELALDIEDAPAATTKEPGKDEPRKPLERKPLTKKKP